MTTRKIAYKHDIVRYVGLKAPHSTFDD